MAASKSPELRLLHIRDEIDGMTSALLGVSFATYRDSYTLRRAAERAVQIVSEAAKSLPPELLARHSSAPWNAIIASAIFFGMNTSASMIGGFGRLSPFTCRN
jgi:uncharacterized protein with HEPN domain